MADTAANRLAGGPKIFTCGTGTGTGTAFPALTGTSISWGSWVQLPSAVNDVTPAGEATFESFEATQYLHPTDSDLVAIGTKNIEIEIKETDIDAFMLGLGTALKGTTAAGTGTAASEYMTQAIANTDFSTIQMALQYTGPAGGWGQVVWFPLVKRSSAPIRKVKRGGVSTFAITFDVFAVQDATLITEGTCSKMYEYVSAPLT